MNFQWLEMRISEEKDRRIKEARLLERLPHALDELTGMLKGCVAAYATAFGPESAVITSMPHKTRITVRDQVDGKWQQRAKIEIITVPTLPGFQVDRGDEPLMLEIGLLPGDKVSYRVGEDFLTTDEVTRRILDRALFPKLRE